ncbi:hypothetical protein [Insolitispirillum peregrinum]|nr:hypothetical protein [Insolitispirillum peregrinum]
MTVNGKTLPSKMPDGLMAHFPNTGPVGASCGECEHFGKTSVVGIGKCLKAAELLKALKCGSPRHKDRIPAHTAACKYFHRKGNEND